MNQVKLAKQKQLLLDYIRERKLLPPNTRYRYSSHEYQCRANEPMMVVLHLDLGDGLGGWNEASFEFTLEELQLFQERRFVSPSDVTSSRPAAQVGKPLPTSTPPAPRVPVSTVDQVNWVSNRESLFANVATLEAETRRYVSMQVDNGRRQMRCRCIVGIQGQQLCGHLQFVYATAWERDKLLDESGALARRQIRLPIGMGLVYVDLDVEILEDDTRPGGQRRTGYVRIGEVVNTGDPFLRRLAEQISPYPSEVDHIILAPGEGTIKAIRYIESLLRGTESYQTLAALSPTNGPAGLTGQADMVCKRTHVGDSGRKLVAEFIAGLRPGNSYRENWMVACAYTIFMSGLCLPCHKATSNSANVPTF
jgi:hypothetical protein